MFGHSSGPTVEKYSVATQIVMGGVSGWYAGFLFQKVGKLAATAVGGGFLLLQIASHSGYVQIDWKRVGKDVNKAKRQTTGWKEIFTNDETDKGFISKIYKQLIQLNTPPEIDTSKQSTHMARTHVKGCSTSLIIRVTRIETTVKPASITSLC